MKRKKSLIMWAEKDWYKDRIMNLKEGLGCRTWTNIKQRFYYSPFNHIWNGEPHTDKNGNDLIKVRIIITEVK